MLSLLGAVAEFVREMMLERQKEGISKVKAIGELYGAITYGINLHSNYSQGSDGRLGNDFIEVKTIAPSNKREETEVNMAGHFSKLLVVKFNEEFEIAHKLIDRKLLRATKGNRLRINWSNL